MKNEHFHPGRDGRYPLFIILVPVLITRVFQIWRNTRVLCRDVANFKVKHKRWGEEKEKLILSHISIVHHQS